MIPTQQDPSGQSIGMRPRMPNATPLPRIATLTQVSERIWSVTASDRFQFINSV